MHEAHISDVKKEKEEDDTPTKSSSSLLLISFMEAEAETEAENEQKVVLRKAVSDVSQEMEKYLIVKSELETIIEEVEQAECECCGLKEECTRVYKRQVQERYCGKWVCGLCAEAVKERVVVVAMEDALNQHKDFCNQYNATTRINPKLSLTLSMREIAKRSLEKRKSMSKLGRSSSYP